CSLQGNNAMYNVLEVLSAPAGSQYADLLDSSRFNFTPILFWLTCEQQLECGIHHHFDEEFAGGCKLMNPMHHARVGRCNVREVRQHLACARPHYFDYVLRECEVIASLGVYPALNRPKQALPLRFFH